MGKEFLKQYEILLKKATVDLNTAKVILETFELGEIELDLEVIMFHLQQSSEKLIKSILDYNKIKFPYSHDIKELVNILNDNKIKLENVEKLIPLSIYSVNGRYSIIHDDLFDAEEYIKIIQSLLIYVKKIVYY